MQYFVHIKHTGKTITSIVELSGQMSAQTGSTHKISREGTVVRATVHKQLHTTALQVGSTKTTM